MIVFDLDDTLIDTTGSFRVQKLRDAFERMLGEGLDVDEGAFEQLLAIDAAAPSVRASLETFLDEIGGERSLAQIAEKEYYENLDPAAPVKRLEGVPEVLVELSADHKLALVTVGIASQQLSKLERAGLDSQIFSAIEVIPTPDKGSIYQKLEANFRPVKTFVCGDKVDVDLVPAKRLGWTTIHMRHGRQGGCEGAAQVVDHAIDSLLELKACIE